MKSRKLITIFIVFLFAFVLVGCSSRNTEEHSTRITTTTKKTITQEQEKNPDTITIIATPKVEKEEEKIKTQTTTNTTSIKQQILSEKDEIEPKDDIEQKEIQPEEMQPEEIQQKEKVELQEETKPKEEDKPKEETQIQEESQQNDKETEKQEQSQQNDEETIITTTDESLTFGDNQKNYGIVELPSSIMDTVEYWQTIYPNMSIGVGLYSLEGTSGYEYNAYTPINSACTIKAAYALFVLKEAEKRDIDIWSTYLTYEQRHSDPDGSGDINLYGYYGNQYSIADLIRLLLQVSDNVAYNMLLDVFTLNDFYMFNSSIGGQCDWSKWGAATVNQRKNEWVEIWNYINSGSLYSQVLREDLTGTQYAYFLQGMQNWHSYMQKSGWTENSPNYPATGEVAIIDDSYILVVLTQDYTYSYGHIDVVQSIGGAVESYWYTNSGYIF